MALTLEDLPEGLVLQAAGFTTNQEAASDNPEGAEAALASFQRCGRLWAIEPAIPTRTLSASSEPEDCSQL